MALSFDQVTAVVLAGGFGTRIRHLLPNLPKPMAPVAGRPFVEWVVRFLAAQGIRNVLISTGYLAEKIEAYFRRARIGAVSVRCFPETTPLGTAGGFLNAARQSGENPAAWLVLNGDSLILTRLSVMSEALDSMDVGICVLGLDVPDASRYGTLERDANDRLRRFSEKKPGAATINAGVYLIRSALIPSFPEKRPLSFEQDAFPVLLNQGVGMQVAREEAPFLDIGTEASLKEAEDFILQNQDHFYIGRVAEDR
jgi:D-glycero-alpha-D-manno-heptose 1-phosphate guanylyltransferase